jgi:hypothetical protein
LAEDDMVSAHRAAAASDRAAAATVAVGCGNCSRLGMR